MEKFNKLSLGIKRLILIFYLLIVFIQFMTISGQHQRTSFINSFGQYVESSFIESVVRMHFVEDWGKSFIFLSVVYWSMVFGIIWVVDGFNKEK